MAEPEATSLAALFGAQNIDPSAGTAGVGKMFGASSQQVLEAENVNTSAVIEAGKYNVVADAAEKSVTFANEESALTEAQIARARLLGTELSSIFANTQQQVMSKLDTGTAKMQEALSAQEQYARLSEEQNQTANPFKKIALWWKRENLSDTVVNTAQEASANFKSAQILQDVTAQKMQMAVSQDTMTRGLENMLLTEDMKRRQKLEAAGTVAMKAVLDQQNSARIAALEAGRGKYGLEQQLEEFSMRQKEFGLRRKEHEKNLADEKFVEDAIMKLRGWQDTPTNRNSARVIAAGIPAQGRLVLGSAANVVMSGAPREQLLRSFSPIQMQQLGSIVGDKDMENFGVRQVNELATQLVSSKLQAEFETAKAQDKTLIRQTWEKSPAGKAALQRAQKQAMEEATTRMNSLPAASLDVSRGAKLPADFDFVAALSADNAALLNKSYTNPAQRNLALKAFANGGPGQVAYKTFLQEARSKSTMDVPQESLQLYALMKTLRSQGLAATDEDAAAIASRMAQVAAEGDLSLRDSTVTTMKNWGYGDAVRPKLPITHNGLPYDLTQKADLLSLSAKMQRQFAEGGGMMGEATNIGTLTGMKYLAPAAGKIDFKPAGTESMYDYSGERADAARLRKKQEK